MFKILQHRAISPLIRFTAVGLASACALTLTAVAPATAAPLPQPTSTSALEQLGISVSADGWITYSKRQSSSLPLTDVTVTVVQGPRTPEGQCGISGEVLATTAPTYSEQIGFNPRSCESRVLSGKLTQAAADTLMARLGSAGGSQSAAQTSTTVPAARSGSAGILTSYQSAHTTTQWIDPLNITITQQAINLQWPLYGAGGTLSSSWPSYAFPYDGWTTYGPYFSGFNTLYDNSGWYVSANSHFVNYDFAALVYFLLGLSGWLACGAHLTTRADFYHNVQVTGYRSGGKNHWWSDSVNGACSNLVHHATLNGYGWW